MPIESMKENHPSRPRKRRLRMCFLAGLAACASANGALADTITFGGVIVQSTQDGTGPAMNNASLNAIKDGDPYSVTLDFVGLLTLPGAFNPLTEATLTFTDTKAGVSEASFGAVSLTLTPDGSFADISLLACAYWSPAPDADEYTMRSGHDSAGAKERVTWGTAPEQTKSPQGRSSRT